MALDNGIVIMWLIAGLLICLAGFVWWAYFRMRRNKAEEVAEIEV